MSNIEEVENVDINEGEKRHKCDVCGKFLSNSKGLNKHIKALHEGKRNHKCDQCGKFFSKSENLKMSQFRAFDEEIWT